MSRRFEELDWQVTDMGEISLRRRLEPMLKVDVYEVKLGEEVIHSAPLVAIEAVEEGGFLRRLWDSIRLFFSGLFD